MGSAQRIVMVLVAIAVGGLFVLLVAGLRTLDAGAREKQCRYLERTDAAVEMAQGGEHQAGGRKQGGCALHGRDAEVKPRGGA